MRLDRISEPASLPPQPAMAAHVDLAVVVALPQDSDKAVSVAAAAGAVAAACIAAASGLQMQNVGPDNSCFLSWNWNRLFEFVGTWGRDRDNDRAELGEVVDAAYQTMSRTWSGCGLDPSWAPAWKKKSWSGICPVEARRRRCWKMLHHVDNCWSRRNHVAVAAGHLLGGHIDNRPWCVLNPRHRTYQEIARPREGD